MKIPFEQIFYGHDGTGYRILRGRDAELNALVLGLCESVGTPQFAQEIRPFLINAPIANRVIMICGQKGRPDNSGRTTLFFHALVCPLRLAEEAGLDAFYLLEKGLFQSSLPEEVPEVFIHTKEVQESRVHVARQKSRLKQVIMISDAPQNKLVRDILGNEVNRRKWMTFSWTPVQDFDFYVLSDQWALPPEELLIVPPEEANPAPKETAREKVTMSKLAHENKMLQNVAIIFLTILTTALALLLCHRFFKAPLNVSDTLQQTTPQGPQVITSHTPLHSQPQVPKSSKTAEDLNKWIIGESDDGSWPDGVPDYVLERVEDFLDKIAKQCKPYDKIIQELEDCKEKLTALPPENKSGIDTRIAEMQKQRENKRRGYEKEINNLQLASIKNIWTKRGEWQKSQLNEKEKQELDKKLEEKIWNSIREQYCFASFFTDPEFEDIAKDIQSLEMPGDWKPAKIAKAYLERKFTVQISWTIQANPRETGEDNDFTPLKQSSPTRRGLERKVFEINPHDGSSDPQELELPSDKVLQCEFKNWRFKYGEKKSRLWRPRAHVVQGEIELKPDGSEFPDSNSYTFKHDSNSFLVNVLFMINDSLKTEYDRIQYEQ
ncbi:MAG: hypothetical protein Q4D38_00850 [Planctomycetia bacterium]|nr:hypothetical protein [Planctomycetia bacterium]